MKIAKSLLSLFSLLILANLTTNAQEVWPKAIKASDGALIKLYQWQPESFSNNELTARAAISVLENGKTDPIFGVAWLNAETHTNGDEVRVRNIQINSIKLPGEIDNDRLEDIKAALENNSAEWNISMPLADLQSALELNKQQTTLSNQINNNPPKILYSSSPSILVIIDGAPKVQYNEELQIGAVINTPFTIVKNNDERFYLYGGKHWYSAPAATGPYELTTSVPQRLKKIEQKVNDSEKKDDAATETDENTIYKIIVSTEPAELVQSKGEPDFSAVEGSGLLYVANSENDIFMDVNTQNYYVLLAGRWYKSKTLSGNWQYISSEKLPSDFARIPEGSPKDHVLASVAGTEAAVDAVQEAHIPQTAKVDRHNANAEVIYDGQPEFEPIDGTDLAYATNTSASVVRWRGRYYSVDNGVWFEAGSAMGPWAVSVSRPYVVALIPPRYPVYHMKYVYIYDVTPDYVWMGYTPGYLNTFIYGPTIVYGTGYYYRPWYRRHYFPRPYTWGFSVRYNPWFGWGIGFSFSTGWFNGGFYSGVPYGYGYGGWWGPRNYRPSYCWSPYRYQGGYYGRSAYTYNRNRGYGQGYGNYYSNNNIYRNRSGVSSRTYTRNYSGDRRGNDRNNFSYNNNRVRNNNYLGNRVSEPVNTRPTRAYNSTRNYNEVNRLRPQGTDANPQYNNRNNNSRINPSRSYERSTPGNIENRNITPRDYNNREPRRNVIVPNGTPQERVERSAPTFRNNNPGNTDRVMPEGYSQPQRRISVPSRPNSSDMQPRERSYNTQPAQRQSERREMIRPNSVQRGDGGNGSRPSRISPSNSQGGNRGRRDN